MGNIDSTMAVLQLISSGGFFGAENVLIELSDNISKRGGHVIVGVINNTYNSHQEICEFAEERNIPWRSFKCTHLLDLRTIINIRKIIKRENIKIIHSHGYKSNFYGFTASLFLKINRVATVHNWIKTDAKLKFYSILDKLSLKQFHCIVAVSEDIKKEIIGSGISEKKVVIIQNGINLEKYSFQGELEEIRSELGINKNARVIGAVGRLAEEKGHAYLIEAATRVINSCPDVTLLIVGDGPLRAKLMEEARCQAIADHVIFAGIRKDIEKMLAIMDVFVMPSLVEAMPMALLEAMAACKSIVATTIGEIPQLISPHHTGLLVPPANSAALADAILYLLNNSKESKELGICGFKKALEFSSKKMTDRYINEAYTR